MAAHTNPTTVLVTGGSGFVASHLILQLLSQGYTVRATVRSLSRTPSILQSLTNAGLPPSALQNLSFVPADLTQDAGWPEAVQGCTYVLHVASPFPISSPKSADELIIPAREGTLRVLRAARDASVKRLVFTSSFAAIGYGHPAQSEPFTESSWSVLGGTISVPIYHQSKTLAERAAWDFISTGGDGLELSVVNPVGVFGPVLGKDISTSIQIVAKLLDGSMPACPKISFGVVDVRDLAELHIRAMVDEGAKGERFIGVGDGGTVSILDIARIVKRTRSSVAGKVPTRELPNWLVRVVGMFDSVARETVPQLGIVRAASNGKAKSVLGWKPRSIEETITDTVDSLVKFGVV